MSNREGVTPAPEDATWDRAKLADLEDSELLALLEKVWRAQTDLLLFGKTRLKLTPREVEMLAGGKINFPANQYRNHEEKT
jgi:hypothetical protein